MSIQAKLDEAMSLIERLRTRIKALTADRAMASLIEEGNRWKAAAAKGVTQLEEFKRGHYSETARLKAEIEYWKDKALALEAEPESEASSG